MQGTVNSREEKFLMTFSASGSRAQGLLQNRTHLLNQVSGMLLMLFYRVQTAGCLTVRDALGQITSMSLDNIRNLKLAIHKDPIFLSVSEKIAASMNKWANEFFGHDTISDWEKQLDFTTIIFRARGLSPRRQAYT